MKRPILIIASGVVMISLLLLVNEKWIKITSVPKTADKTQESESVQQSSPTSPKKKTATKPTSKPPVYDLSKKTHWYDPETTISAGIGAKLLSEILKPFHPTPQEFQYIAQYETLCRKLKESLSEDEYYSMKGRQSLVEEIEKLNKQLLEQLGEERLLFYREVQNLHTGCYNTWKALTTHGISEDRVPEFREMAEEFNQQMYGRSLYKGVEGAAHPPPREDFSIDLEEQMQIAETFQDRIEKDFGKHVLDDILTTGGILFYMNRLDLGTNPSRRARLFSLSNDSEYRAHMMDLYNFEIIDDEEIMKKHRAERERLEAREMELMEEVIKHYATEQIKPEEDSGGSP